MPQTVDGLSLVKLFSNASDWRTTLLLEAWPDRGHWTAIHTADSIYIETDNDLSEFYDLTIDPYEMDNRINDPKYAVVIAQLKSVLDTEKLPKTTPPSDSP
jgi:hypothetical protein